MRYFSMFTGVGGFELGIEYALLQPQDDELQLERDLSEFDGQLLQGTASCIGFSEVDKYANQVLKYRFPNIKNYGDCKTINWNEVPDFDLLVGGSPCQDLSVAGKRAGLSGERSGLFAEFVRALQEKKPKYFIWENVKGTLSSNQGWDFAEVQAQMAEAGYSLWWQVLNAKDFGVPQNRERIFVVGTRGESGREVLLERGTGKQNTESVKVVRQPLRYLNRNQKNIEGDYAFCIDASQTSGVRIYDDYNSKWRQDKNAGTLTGNIGSKAERNGQKVFYGVRIRRLTPTECERLMSWPDDHTRWGINDKGEKVEMSDTQRYKMCGNGVVSEVVKAVFNELIKK